MIRRRRKNAQSPGHGAPSWVLTFGDMMSLLLCFFIAIVSFSSIEIDRYRAALGSFRGALQSPFSSSNTPSGQLMPSLSDKVYEEQEIVETAAEIKSEIQNLTSRQGIETEILPEGVKITLSNPFLFDEGSDQLKIDALPFLGSISRILLKREPIEVFIEGHTDNTPIHTAKFPSNWELSAARALAVLKLFQQSGVPPQKMVAIGYGEYRPKEIVSSAASATEKGVNRRVEIMLQQRSGHSRPAGSRTDVTDSDNENRVGGE